MPAMWFVEAQRKADEFQKVIDTLGDRALRPHELVQVRAGYLEEIVKPAAKAMMEWGYATGVGVFVAQYWDDGADDEVHLKIVPLYVQQYGDDHKPLTPDAVKATYRAEYENAARPFDWPPRAFDEGHAHTLHQLIAAKAFPQEDRNPDAHCIIRYDRPALMHVRYEPLVQALGPLAPEGGNQNNGFSSNFGLWEVLLRSDVGLSP